MWSKSWHSHCLKACGYVTRPPRPPPPPPPPPPLTAEDYDEQVVPYVALWEEEKRRLEAEAAAAEEAYNSLENVKARKLSAIDAETSSAIMAGFGVRGHPAGYRHA